VPREWLEQHDVPGHKELEIAAVIGDAVHEIVPNAYVQCFVRRFATLTAFWSYE